jgi:hypothetical protein
MASLFLLAALWNVAALPPGIETGKSRALLVVGIPGDAEHQAAFETTAQTWRKWLTETLDFDAAEVRILFGKTGMSEGARGPATKAALEKEISELREALKPEDRLWVYFLGHADYDGTHARFHLSGRDLRDDEVGKLFANLKCREQVFWLTSAASGWFVRALSAKNRIVIAATAADAEFNETEFPHALATAARQSREQLDLDHDGKVSVLELYRRTVEEVQARFAADKRVPTEHAQLDDNGDGVGTEDPAPKKPNDKAGGKDGDLAAQTFLRWRKPKD